jgi:aspartate aminotransferase
LAAVIAGTEAMVISDEIYQRISYDRPAASFAAAVPGLVERTILVNGVSKSYSMTGWRIGFAAGPPDAIRAMNLIQSHSTSNANSIAQYAALEAYRGPQDSVDDMRDEFRARRDAIVALLNRIPGVDCRVPDGAFYVFPSVKGALGRRYGEHIIENSLELATWLLENAYVATVPGEAFGAPGYLRLSYACGLQAIREGIARIADALAPA